MIFTLTIAAIAKELRAGSLHISKTANGRTTASFQILSADRSYRPPLDGVVSITEDAVVIFGGLIDRTLEQGYFKGTHPGIVTTVSAVDFNLYTEWRYVNETIPAGTLKAALQAVESYLTPFGVTLHGSQVNGPNLPELTYEYRRLDDVLNEFATLTADAGDPYVWNISETKVLRMYQPSTVAAPFDLVGNNLAEVIGDLEVENSRDGYANKIIIKAVPKTEMSRTETFTEGVDTYPYVLQYTPFATRGYVTHAGIFETLRIPADPNPASWTLSGNTLTRDAGAPSGGDVSTINFDGTFSGSWTAEDGTYATNPRELVIFVESIPTDTTGQAFADSELAKHLAEKTTARYTTWEQGVEPGQEQIVNVSARNVNETAALSDVVIRDLVHRLERRVTAVVDATKTNLNRGWRDVYKVWAGDKAAGTTPQTAVGSGPVTQSGPGGPDTAVQFNNAGAFGGDDAFRYEHAQNSLICGGGGSSITSTNYESCQVFGYNTHIEDP